MDSEREAQHSRSHSGGNGSIISDPKAVPSDGMVSQPPKMSSSVDSPSSLDQPSGEFIQLDPDLIFECALSLQDVPYNPLPSEASSKSEQDDSGWATVGTSPASSDLTHEPAVLLRKPLTQSPPIQVMERPAATSYDPNRIPSCVFESSKSPSSMAWSIASNESLFSIQIGNNASYSREHVLKFCASGELHDSVGQSYKSIETTSSSPSSLAVQEGRESDGNYMRTKIKFSESAAGGADRKIDDGEDADQVLGASIAGQRKEDRLAQEPSMHSHQSASNRQSSVVSKKSNKHTSSSCHYCSCSCGPSSSSSCCKLPSRGCCTPGSCNCCIAWPSFSCCKCASCNSFENCLSCDSCKCSNCCKWPSCICCTTWPSSSCWKSASCNSFGNCLSCDSCKCSNCCKWPSCNCFKWPTCSFRTCSGCSYSLWPSYCCCNSYSRPGCISSHCWKYFCCSWSSMWKTISCCYSKKTEGSSIA